MHVLLRAPAAFKPVAASLPGTEPHLPHIPPVNRKAAAYTGSKPGMVYFAEPVFIKQRAAENELAAGGALSAFPVPAGGLLPGSPPGQRCQAQPAQFPVKQNQVAFRVFKGVADIHEDTPFSQIGCVLPIRLV